MRVRKHTQIKMIRIEITLFKRSGLKNTFKRKKIRMRNAPRREKEKDGNTPKREKEEDKKPIKKVKYRDKKCIIYKMRVEKCNYNEKIGLEST